MSHYERTFKEFEERCYLDYVLRPNPAPEPFHRSYEGLYYIKFPYNSHLPFRRVFSMEG